MSHAPQLRFSARCPGCLVVHALLPSGRLYRHLPCGTGKRPAPTLLGQELEGRGAFPEDVTEVRNRRGKRLHRTPQGWAFDNGAIVGLWVLADHGPYLVTAVDPSLLPDAR